MYVYITGRSFWAAFLYVVNRLESGVSYAIINTYMPKLLSPFFKKLFNLRDGAEDKDVIVENIRDDAEFSSARLWTLMFAILIASIGLNINSIPLVIGAMLISPLMGPIVSIGLSLTMNDWHLLRKSFRNFLILVGISIGVSSLYFALSPITNAQSELLSRIEPTIFDVLVAIFGGMAGFIGISRSRQSTVVPGVAIATALMPPLCTIGYGVGTLQAKFVFGALYLFMINSVFICLSALLISKYLKIPKVRYENEAFQKRARRIITAVIVVIVTPALYLAFTFVERNNFYLNTDAYIQTVFEDRGHVVIYEDVTYGKFGSRIELAFLSSRFSPEQITELEARLVDYNLKNTELVIRQNNFSFSDVEWQQLLAEMESDSEKVRALEARIQSGQTALPKSEDILGELRVLEPRVRTIGVGQLSFAGVGENEQGEESLAVTVYLHEGETVRISEADMLTRWLTERLNDEKLVTYFIPAPAIDVMESATSTEEG
jgi:uncharacterized hydrophobic protein (TIGR00271 family)